MYKVKRYTQVIIFFVFCYLAKLSQNVFEYIGRRIVQQGFESFEIHAFLQDLLEGSMTLRPNIFGTFWIRVELFRKEISQANYMNVW